MASELGYDQGEPPAGQIRPRFWVVNVSPERNADPPNWSLAPLESNRPIVPVEREVVFQTAIDLHGQKAYSPPQRVSLEVDGKRIKDLAVPRSAELDNGRVPFSFTHRFATAGSHLVTVLLEPDPPPDERPFGYTVKDEVPGDNRQDFAIEVVQVLPVLIVDGTLTPIAAVSTAGRRSSDFLRDALAPARDPTPIIQVRVVGPSDFDPALLAAPESTKSNEGAVRPRVLILSNIPRLSAAQQEAVTHFLADGGGVLVTLGDRVEAESYNGQLHRNGAGWLPAHLDRMEGDADKLDTAVHPAPGGTDHPALRLFLQKANDGQGPARFPQLGQARFPRWWKVSPPNRKPTAVQVAALRSTTTEYPFLVEWIDPNRAGRLLLCTVPLDNSWNTNLINLPAFVPLAHELVYYLAGTRSTEVNLEPGQPLRYRLESSGRLDGFTLQTPLGETKPLGIDPADKNVFLATVDRLPQGAVLRHEGMRETGVYRLRTPENSTVYYAVRPRRAEESNLTPCTEEDREKVAKIIPNLKYQNDRDQLTTAWVSETHRQELWSWLLLGLIVLLCAEVWMTRRIVRQR